MEKKRQSDYSHSRRRILAGGLSVALLPSHVYANSTEALRIPYEPIWPIPGPFANCYSIKQAIQSANFLRNRVVSNDLDTIDVFIKKQTDHLALLKAELKQHEARKERLEKKILIQRIAVIAGLVFIMSSAFVSAPLAIGAQAGLELVGGSLILGLQAVYAEDGTPQLGVAYMQSRATFFGALIGEQAGSLAGRLLARSFSILGIALDVFSLSETHLDIDKLEQRMTLVNEEALRFSNLLQRYSPNDRALWKAIMLNFLDGTINGLSKIVTLNSTTDCRVITRSSTQIKRP